MAIIMKFEKITSKFPNHCANLACPNKPYQGSFDVVETTDKQLVSNSRPIQLYLCSPCARSFLVE